MIGQLVRIIALILLASAAWAGTPPSTGSLGIGSNSGSTTVSPTLSLSHAGSQAAVFVIATVNQISAVAVPVITSVVGNTPGDNLVFTKRTQQQQLNLTGGCGGGNSPCSVSTEVWWSPANVNFVAHSVTVTWGTTFFGAVASAIEVYNLNDNTAPFDTNGSLPVVNKNAAAGVASFSGFSTSQADDLILSIVGEGGGLSNGVLVVPCFLTFASWADFGNQIVSFGSIGQSAYSQQVSATQSGIGVNTSLSTLSACPGGTTQNFGWVMIVDALTGNAPAASRGSGWTIMK